MTRVTTLRFSLCALSLCALSLCASIATGADAEDAKNADWPVYLGGQGRALCSPLQQLNRETVSQLEVAWTYDTGDKANIRQTI